MKSVSRNLRSGYENEPGHLQRTQGMLAEYLQYIRQQCDPGTEENKSDNIERMGVLFTVVGQMQINEDQTHQSDWNIEKEDEAPMKIADDEAAGDGAQHRSDQGRYRDKAHRAQKIRLGKCPYQSKPAYGNHHRAAATLQDSTHNEQMNVARYSAQQGA